MQASVQAQHKHYMFELQDRRAFETPTTKAAAAESAATTAHNTPASHQQKERRTNTLTYVSTRAHACPPVSVCAI